MSIDNNIKEVVLSWILKEKEGLSKEDKANLELFLQKKEHLEYYYKYKELFYDCDSFNEDEKASIKELIQSDKRRTKLRFILTPLAASIIFILFFVFNYYETSQMQYENIYVANDEKKLNILLPDDSLVDLDIKTKIDVSYYGNKRLVNLSSGKAVFSVTKDKNRPFIIKNKKINVEVLGTKFEVINLNKIHTISVLEGVVRVSYNYSNKAKNLIILKQGDSFSLQEDGKVLGSKKINIQNIAKWKENLLQFENISLKEALDEFARYNNLNIVFDDYEISQIKISGIFNIKKVNSFLDSLPEIYPLKIKKQNNTIKILKAL